MSLAAVMEEARKKAIAETDIVIPKDDGLLLVYALLLDRIGEGNASSKETVEATPDDSAGNAPSAAKELEITARKIAELRAGIYDLVDAAIASTMEAAPGPAPSPPDRIARALAGFAASCSLATLLVVIMFQGA